MCSLAEAMRLFVPGKTSIKRQAVKDASGKLLYYAYEERLKEKTVLHVVGPVSDEVREHYRERADIYGFSVYIWNVTEMFHFSS